MPPFTATRRSTPFRPSTALLRSATLLSSAPATATPSRTPLRPFFPTTHLPRHLPRRPPSESLLPSNNARRPTPTPSQAASPLAPRARRAAPAARCLDLDPRWASARSVHPGPTRVEQERRGTRGGGRHSEMGRSERGRAARRQCLRPSCTLREIATSLEDVRRRRRRRRLTPLPPFPLSFAFSKYLSLYSPRFHNLSGLHSPPHPSSIIPHPCFVSVQRGPPSSSSSSPLSTFVPAVS